mgnify:CR=1 FL=1
MNVDALEQQYLEASKTDDFNVHTALVEVLLTSDDVNVLELHYQCLRDRSNRDLYLRLRAAFAKRRSAAADFLLDKVAHETDTAARNVSGRSRSC